MGFFAELKRRSVVRVAIAYAVGTWVLLQIADTFAPILGLPEWSGKLILFILIIGFIPAMLFSWAYELTPTGFKRDHEVKHASVHTTNAVARKLDLITIGLVVAAVTLLAVDRWVLPPRNVQTAANEAANNAATAQVVDNSAVRRDSLAVLPLVQRSSREEDQFFTDGIHDDLLTRLANIESLKVISRTSVMKYRDSDKNLRQIGQELGVSTILEGSVQRSGDAVRINVQLIDANTDEHLWAKIYDRTLNAKNLFEIQTEISTAIATALHAHLSPQEQARLASIPTENIEAFRLYTAGRQNLHQRELTTLKVARRQFEQAIALDQNFAQAHAGLADAIQLLSINHNEIPWNEAEQLANQSLRRALDLDSELADGYASLGLLKMQQSMGSLMMGAQDNDDHMADAEMAFQRALALNPSHARAYMWLASLRGKQHRYEDAIELFKRSIEYDPLGRISYTNLAVMYATLGRSDDALNVMAEALRIHPSWSTLHRNISAQLEGLGRYDEAYAWARQARQLAEDPSINLEIVRVLIEFEEFEEVERVLNSVPEEHMVYGFAQAYLAAIEGDPSAALEALDLAYKESPSAPPGYHYLASDLALLAGDYETAMERCLSLNPALAEDIDPKIDNHNDQNIVKFAFLLQKKGESERAQTLLRKVLREVQKHPRLGMKGEGIRDVQILTLLGREDEALSKLQAAVDSGFRGSISFNNWRLEDDPYLSALRDRPEFKAVQSEIKQYVDVMKQRVIKARESEDWDSLLAPIQSPIA